MCHRTRHRRLTAWLAVLALLFQQLAMAAYVCDEEVQPFAAGAMADCADTIGSIATDLSRCHEHCNPTSVVADHASPLTVPAAMPGPIALPVPAPMRSAGRRVDAPRLPRATAPPLHLRYCSLQI